MPESPGQDADELHEEREHERPDDGRGAVSGERREQEADADDGRHRDHVDGEAGRDEAERVPGRDVRARRG